MCGLPGLRHGSAVASKETAMSRTMIFIYGVISYLLCLAAFVYGMGFIGGAIVPTSLDAAPRRPLGYALAVDLGLLSIFAIQHSGMARPAFKRWWTRTVAHLVFALTTTASSWSPSSLKKGT